MVDDKLIEIGRISGPHGLKGEFKVIPLTDFPERFKDMKTLNLYDPESGQFLRTLDVKQVRNRPEKGHVLILASEICYVDQAEALRGSLIKIGKDEMVDLPEGEYWVDDLVGLDIVDYDSGEKLGVLVEIATTGASDLYFVDCCDGKKRHIPAVKEFIKEIDMEQGKISVHLIEGLWDL